MIEIIDNLILMCSEHFTLMKIALWIFLFEKHGTNTRSYCTIPVKNPEAIDPIGWQITVKLATIEKKNEKN